MDAFFNGIFWLSIIICFIYWLFFKDEADRKKANIERYQKDDADIRSLSKSPEWHKLHPNAKREYHDEYGWLWWENGKPIEK